MGKIKNQLISKNLDYFNLSRDLADAIIGRIRMMGDGRGNLDYWEISRKEAEVISRWIEILDRTSNSLEEEIELKGDGEKELSVKGALEIEINNLREEIYDLNRDLRNCREAVKTLLTLNSEFSKFVEKHGQEPGAASLLAVNQASVNPHPRPYMTIDNKWDVMICDLPLFSLDSKEEAESFLRGLLEGGLDAAQGLAPF